MFTFALLSQPLHGNLKWTGCSMVGYLPPYEKTSNICLMPWGGGGGVGEMDRLGIDKAIMLLVSYRQPVPDPYIEA